MLIFMIYMAPKLSEASTGSNGNIAETKHATAQGQKSFPLSLLGQDVIGQVNPMVMKPTLQTARLVYPNLKDRVPR